MQVAYKKKGVTIGAIMTVIVAAIGLSIGIWVMAITFSAVDLPGVNAITTNETNTSAVATYYDLPRATNDQFVSLDTTSLSITNTTNTLPAANYTAYSNGTIGFSPSLNQSLYETLYFTYTSSDVSDAAWTGFSNVQTTSWAAMKLLAIGLIVLAFGVIIAGFYFKSQ